MKKLTTPTTVYEDKQYFYLSDHLGSSSWITDKDGNALQHLSYLPFGEVFANQKASGSSFDAEFKFLGKELDSETGYTKTDNRYYWANAGIFLSVDPLCDKYPMLTPYNYAGNNPLIFRDPSGLDFDPTIDHKNKTITINATYYTSNKNKAHLQKALNAWNEQSGKYYFTPEGSNKEYVINFNLKIAEGNFDTDDDALNAFGSDKSGSANYFQFGEVATNERGHTFDGNQITVSKEAPNRTSSHEVGHTLGIGHFQFGLMETGGNDDKISIGNVANILKTAKFDVKIPEVIRNNQIDNNGGGRAKTTHNIKGRVHY